MGALATYVEKRWGVKTRTIEHPELTPVAAGVTRVLTNNPDRFEAIIVNHDTVKMRLSPGPDTSDTIGIPLDASGGFVILTADDDGESVGYEWFIWSAAGGEIYVLETEAA